MISITSKFSSISVQCLNAYHSLINDGSINSNYLSILNQYCSNALSMDLNTSVPQYPKRSISISINILTTSTLVNQFNALFRIDWDMVKDGRRRPGCSHAFLSFTFHSEHLFSICLLNLFGTEHPKNKNAKAVSISCIQF
jgi:hypothetical protein